jgi:hypothetical protein
VTLVVNFGGCEHLVPLCKCNCSDVLAMLGIAKSLLVV